MCCALTAGIHAGLVPAHLHESARLGIAFALATALLAVVAVALSRRPASRWPAASAALLLAGLIAAYSLSRTVGLSPLGAERESLDPLGAATKLVEAAGLVAAAWLFTQVKSSARSLAGRATPGG